MQHLLKPRRTVGSTFPLVLISLAVAVVAMHFDRVPRYSANAFWIGLFATVLFALVIGRVTELVTPQRRALATLALPTVGGALIGMVLQAIVWDEVKDHAVVHDLQGLVSTRDPLGWVGIGGFVLGAVPALLVAAFLWVAARALRGRIGHDAAEDFRVPFVGFAGMVAAGGLLVVDVGERAPLVGVAALAAIAQIVSIVADRSRLALLRKVFAGDAAFTLLPRERFGSDPSLAPLVHAAGATHVIVQVVQGSYREAAGAPIALVPANESEAKRPVIRRLVLAATTLALMGVLTAGVMLSQAYPG